MTMTYDERQDYIRVRLECSRIAAAFFPELGNGVTIQGISQVVYDWVTEEDDE